MIVHYLFDFSDMIYGSLQRNVFSYNLICMYQVITHTCIVILPYGNRPG